MGLCIAVYRFFDRWLLARISLFFFFNDTATTEIYTLSLHDALPICQHRDQRAAEAVGFEHQVVDALLQVRSEEHTSELQSPDHLVCRLLLEKKKSVAAVEPEAITLIITQPQLIAWPEFAHFSNSAHT